MSLSNCIIIGVSALLVITLLAGCRASDEGDASGISQPQGDATGAEGNAKTSLYRFSAKTLAGEQLSLDRFQGKVILVVNTASKCGFTPQYEGLETLYQKYNEQGLEILGFPCNQFGGQEPGTADEIQHFCQMNYGVTFTMFDKIEVNGDGAHPLYKWLKDELPGLAGSKSIKWNFTKFLIDLQGNPVKRYAPKTSPDSLAADIEKLL